MKVRHWSLAERGDFAVLGSKVDQSFSPAMHRVALDGLGHRNLSYQAFLVPQAEELRDALAHLADLGYRGVNCTNPLKFEAYAWAASCDEFAKKSESANCLDLATGKAANTDTPGFLATLSGSIVRKVLILGAGGVASALVSGLDPAQVTIWNRTEEKARELAAKFGAAWTSQLDVETFDLVVNCTSAARAGESLPISWSTARPGQVAYDTNYGASARPFLSGAEAAGWQIEDGLAMLVEQGALSLEFWGVGSPDRGPMLDEVRRLSSLG